MQRGEIFVMNILEIQGRISQTLTPVTPRLMEAMMAVIARRVKLMPLGRVCKVENGPTMSWKSISG